jgi:hypothetical protein
MLKKDQNFPPEFSLPKSKNIPRNSFILLFYLRKKSLCKKIENSFSNFKLNLIRESYLKKEEKRNIV